MTGLEDSQHAVRQARELLWGAPSTGTLTLPDDTPTPEQMSV